MEIAILVFFAAIFGGVLFLLALVWFIFRRVRKSRQPGRHFSGGKAHGGHSGTHYDSIDSDDHDAAFLAGNAFFDNQYSYENQVYTGNAPNAATENESYYSRESYDSGSSYESGSSYDSSSSYDSGSSSSDSGGSSSSSSSSD